MPALTFPVHCCPRARARRSALRRASRRSLRGPRRASRARVGLRRSAPRAASPGLPLARRNGPESFGYALGKGRPEWEPLVEHRAESAGVHSDALREDVELHLPACALRAKILCGRCRLFHTRTITQAAALGKGWNRRFGGGGYSR